MIILFLLASLSILYLFFFPLPSRCSPTSPSLSFCHSSFTTGLWCAPETDGALQDGRCFPGNGMKRVRDGLRYIFFFPTLFGFFTVQVIKNLQQKTAYRSVSLRRTCWHLGPFCSCDLFFFSTNRALPSLTGERLWSFAVCLDAALD